MSGDIDFFLSTGEREQGAVSALTDLFEFCAGENVSDIHMEGIDDGRVEIRLRIGNRLRHYGYLSKGDGRQAELKLRSRAQMSLTDMRREMDGRFTQKAGGRRFDIRINILPTIVGSSIVMRLLDSQKAGMSLTDLDMPADVQAAYLDALSSSEGMIVNTGPTKSGKTMTLYAGMAVLNRPDQKIITIEDPVEGRLAGAQQVQVGGGSGRTFASALRAVLRQNPNAVLVGEMRDPETASVGVEASLFGSILLSSTHANSAILTPLRLHKLGVDYYSIGAALLAVMAQRLPDRLCNACAVQRAPTRLEREMLIAEGVSLDDPNFRDAVGCPNCNGTGFRGMVPIFEFLRVSDQPDAVECIDDRFRLAEVARRQPQYRTLRQDALRQIAAGKTTIGACARVLTSLQYDITDATQREDCDAGANSP
jgi:type II secretory ATPase GspE/PulE/Tfp pilus assembly ATPase PilB-like protein